MVRRAGCVIALFLALVFPATADVSNAELIGLAEQYQSSILPADASKPVTEILKELNEARKAGDVARIIRLSEQLVAQGDHNAQSWLSLSKAWALSDPAANKGLGAAIRAVQVSQTRGDRLEALLLASHFLRSRLEKDRARYDEAVGATECSRRRAGASRRTRPGPGQSRRPYQGAREDTRRCAKGQQQRSCRDLGDGGRTRRGLPGAAGRHSDPQRR